MSYIKKFNWLFIFISSALLIPCGNTSYNNKTSINGIKSDAENSCDSFYDDFSCYDSKNWLKSGIWANGGIFNCKWHPNQVNFSTDNSLSVMSIILDDNEFKDRNQLYRSGEIRTNKRFGYGLYEVRMKPVMHCGVVSSFFVYTSEYDEKGRPWDEIDIEFIIDPNGGNPNPIMQANYFTNGIGNHEYKVDLAFDATLDYHVYAFKWEHDKITWYIDGVEVYSASKNIPSHAGKIEMNLWPTINADSWTGKCDGKVPLVVYYDWVRYTPLKVN